MSILNHPVVQSIAQNKIRFTVEHHHFDHTRPHVAWPALIIEGFSKSGTVMLYIEGGQLKALARYNEVTTINDFDDLVALAYDWWHRYHGRSPFETPHSMWLPHFLSRGWIEEVKTVTYKAAK